MLNTLAVLLLSPVLVISLRRLGLAFKERSELATQAAVRWATIALGLSLCVALAELAFVYVDRAHTLSGPRALWEGLRAAKNLCAPPLGVSGAMLYLSRLFRTAARAAQ
ncbi:MAG TPA: hypothetical protein VFX59_30955 [Polyangiales bacterium]|nr:hypothetical protein [Polyangiales bacterium]